MSDELTVPDLEDRERLAAAWSAICQKIDQPLTTFPLRFGPHWDWPRSIFRSGDGWSVVDVYRGDEQSRRYITDDETLLYDSAKWMTSAVAGWRRSANMSRFSKALGRIYHSLDRRFDLRLQLRQQRAIEHRYQRELMARISTAWANRLDHEFRGDEMQR
ncbi:MAG TPA: hypothetical protein VIZ66_07080 [Sphingomicrobium sp.]